MTGNLGLLIIQIIIILLLFWVVIYLIRQNVSIQHERRISRYSIDSIKGNNPSVFDNVWLQYYNFIKKMRKPLSKSVFLTRKSKKYDKYLLFNNKNIKSIDYITNKLIVGFLFALLTIFSKVLQLKVISMIELIIFFFIGYYLLDIYLIIQNKRRKKLIENEMLRAIIIMSNAFKAGKSTLQAVEIASNELPEPISDEFKKMLKDLEYGLSIDTVFERFAKRVEIEEAIYLSSSLTVLNKTGGNIVNVFSSIEKTLFNKKKLKEELKNLTVSSNMIVKILLVVPIIFVLIIYLLNPSYFNPLFDSILGYMILGIIFIMFIIYIWFLQKIMKVKV